MPETPETTRGPYSFAIGEYLPGTEYVLRKQLGQGGMGVVFEVVKHPHLVGVAKIMLPQYAKNAEMVARFHREVSILAKLNHPHIVRVKDCATLADGTPFYVMDKVEGTSLRTFLHDMPAPPPKMVYEIMRGLLEGLYCIHQKGIVHRDIKPENIVLDAPEYGDPGVKLIDFGIADDATSEHVPGAVIGTLSYSAREQLLGEKGTIQTDIFAAAVVFYEMVAQRRPFDYARARGEKAYREEMTDLTKPAPPLRFYAPWIPEDAEKIIMAALSKDPKERPETAYEFLTNIYNVKTAEFTPRIITEMNTTEPEFTTAIESAARAMNVQGESTARYDLAPPVEGSAPELAPENVLRELESRAQAHAPASHPTMSAPDAPSAVRVAKNGTAPLAMADLLPTPRRGEPSPAPERTPPVDVSANGPVSHTVTTPKPRRRDVSGYAAMFLSMTVTLGAVAAWRAHGQSKASPAAAVAPAVATSHATASVPPPSAPTAVRVLDALPPSAATHVPAVASSAPVAVAEHAHEAPAAPSASAPKATARATTVAPSSPPVRARVASAPKASSEPDDSIDDLLALPKTVHRPKAGL